MRASLQQIIIVSTCFVTMSQWFDAPLVVGGKTILFFSELTLYVHLLILLALTGGKLNVPKRVVKIFFPLLVYFIAHLLYSLLFADAANAILTTRRLIYYPAIALTVGYATSVASASDGFVNKVLNLSLRLSIPLIVLNILLRFHLFQEFGFISRASGVILCSLVFNGLLILIDKNSSAKQQVWVSLAAFLFVFVTSSRGVYLAFFSTLGLLIWQHRRMIGVVRLTKLTAGGIVSVGIIAAIALNSPLVITTLEKFGTDISNVVEGDMGSHGNQFNTLGARYYLYEAAFSLGLESPVFGNGSGFKVEQWHLGGSYNIDRSKTPHNYYLDIWYRLGAVGLILFFLFYRNLLRELKRKQEPVYYMLIVALIYSSFDVLLSSTTSAIIPIFFLVGASLYSHTDQSVRS